MNKGVVFSFVWVASLMVCPFRAFAQAPTDNQTELQRLIQGATVASQSVGLNAHPQYQKLFSDLGNAHFLLESERVELASLLEGAHAGPQGGSCLNDDTPRIQAACQTVVVRVRDLLITYRSDLIKNEANIATDFGRSHDSYLGILNKIQSLPVPTAGSKDGIDDYKNIGELLNQLKVSIRDLQINSMKLQASKREVGLTDKSDEGSLLGGAADSLMQDGTVKPAY
jgi:hypothetical protein